MFKPVIDGIVKSLTSIKTEHMYLAGDFVNLKYLKGYLEQLTNPFKVDILDYNTTTRGAIQYALKQPLLIDRIAPRLIGIDKPSLDPGFYNFDYKEYTHVIGIGI